MNTNHAPIDTGTGFRTSIGFTAATKVRHNVDITSRYAESVRLATLAINGNSALTARVAELEAALRAVIGNGYESIPGTVAAHDYVKKDAIAKVRAALTKGQA